MRTRPLGVAGLLVAALALAGCAASPTTAPSAGASDRTITPTAAPQPPDAVPSHSPSQPSPSAPTAGAYVEYRDGAIEATAGPKVLFFHASWCPKCRQLDEQLNAEGPPDGLTIFKVDYDSRTDLRQRYGVTLQTTVVFVDDEGELISSTVLYDDPSIESLIAAMP